MAQLQTDLDSIPGYDVDVDGLFGSKTYSTWHLDRRPPLSAKLGTAGSSGMAKYTRMAHSFFGDRACISGYCAPLGQSWLWYDSTDSSGHDLRRIQLN